MASTKLSFDPINKIITVIEAPTLIDGEMVVAQDVKIDFYSDAKEDWLVDPDLNKFRFPFGSVGGNPTIESNKLGSTYFLDAGWLIRPYEADHVFRINGNFYTRDGKSPYTKTLGAYSVNIESTVSNLVDSTVQQLAEIEYASFGGMVSVDIDSPYTYANELLAGNQQYPVNNYPDAKLIDNARGFGVLGIRKTSAIATTDFSGFEIIARSHTNVEITVESAANVENVVIRNARLKGTLDGGTDIWDCIVGAITYFNGHIHRCSFTDHIILGGGVAAYIANCSQENVETYPTLSMGGAGQDLTMVEYTGIMTIYDCTDAGSSIGIGLTAGQIVLDTATCTAGFIHVSGNGSLVDELGTLIPTGTWNGMTVINELISNESVANATWDHQTSDHIEQGSFGAEVATKADINAATETSQETADSGVATYGTPTGTYLDTFVRDGNYWQITEDVTNGIQVVMSFIAPTLTARPGTFTVFGRYEGVPSTTHFQDLDIYNWETLSWELLSEEFMPGGNTSDTQFVHEFYTRHINETTGEVQFRIRHHTTTYSASHNLYLDYVEASFIEVITADDIANAVWANIAGEVVKKMIHNKVVMAGDIATIYEDNGTDVWKTFNLANDGRIEL